MDENVPTCRWCSGVEDPVELLQQYCSGLLEADEKEAANKDLWECNECVVAYHKARDQLPALHERLWELEMSRLLRGFSEWSEKELEDNDLFIIEDDQEKRVPKHTPAEYVNVLRFPITEILQYPYLMGDPKLSEMCVQALCKMEEMENPFQVFDRPPGIYLLLVHPNEKVRRWAIRVARVLGKVKRDDFYDLEEIYSCMFSVIKPGISCNFPDLGTSYDPRGKMLTLPRHLYDSSNEKNYWLGICMLVTQLDSKAMDSLFLGSERQTNILQCILKTMERSGHGGEPNADTDPFWPALQCFMVILDRLGSKIWAPLDTVDTFYTIIRSPSYTAEIESIRRKTMASCVKVEMEGDEDMVTCSQIVYDCYIKEKKNKDCSQSSPGASGGGVLYDEMRSLVDVLHSERGQAMRLYHSTFLWLYPFVQSIVEYDGHNGGYIGEVVHYLHREISGDLLSGRMRACDKVTEYFVHILVYIVELHLGSGRMGALHGSAFLWVEVLVKCAMLPPDVCSAGPSEGGLAAGWGAVSSTSFATLRRGGVVMRGAGPLGAGRAGNGLTYTCMKTIRSLLKEGGRLGTDSSLHFLNVVNKQLREATPCGWSLSEAAVAELQRCLRNVVTEIVRKTATVVIAVPSPPPVPLAEPMDGAVTTATSPRLSCSDGAGPSGATEDDGSHIKEEPLWNYGGCSPARVDGFAEGLDLKALRKVKKEPLAPLLILDSSRPAPALELTHMKPDLGKLQQLKSRLSENLPKIQAIATKQQELVRPQSSRPSTSHLDELDDEPLNVLRSRLKKQTRRLDSDTDSEDEQRSSSVGCSSEAKPGNPESSGGRVIIISSDDEVSTSDGGGFCSPGKAVPRCLKSEPLEEEDDAVLVDSPGRRDYDGDLSESQVFEFETPEFVASAWGDSYRPAVSTPEPRTAPEPRARSVTPPPPVERSSSLEYETDPVPDEAIEAACLQAEEQEEIWKKQQASSVVGSPALPKCSSSSAAEQRDLFTKPKPLLPAKSLAKSPGKKGSLAGKKGKLQETKAPLIIEALARKIKSTLRSCSSTSSRDVEIPSSPTTSSPTTSSPFLAPSSVSSPLFATPAIVPPRKIRKPVEPESTVERLGLKKKERKAFDLSQRSLDSVGELRRYGQNLRVEPQQKKRVRRSSKSTKPKVISPQKLKVKGNRKMLASQYLQFLRQSRDAAKSTKDKVARPAVAEEEPEVEEEKEDDEFHFLPCSQPDPDQRSSDGQVAMGTKMVEAGGANGRAQSNRPTTSTHILPNEAAAGEESVNGNEEEEYDEEWMFMTQMEPTDMELCSQIDRIEEQEEEDFFLTQRDPVDMDIDADSQSNVGGGGIWLAPPPVPPAQRAPPPRVVPDDGRVFLKPGMSPLSQKRAKPSTTKIYAPSSRSATLAQEMEKPMRPPATASKVKFARPAMPPPQPATPQPTAPKPATPQPERRQSLFPPNPLPRPLSHAPRSILSSSVGKAAAHPPTYKMYSRPEAPVAMPTAPVGQKFDLSFLIHTILKWDHNMFCSYKQFGPPSDLCPLPLGEVPPSFKSYQDYFNIFYPLLLTNTFEELASEWLKERRISLDLKVLDMDYSTHCASANFTACLTPQQESQQLYPKEDDLVILWLPQNTGAYARDEPFPHERQAHFGCVSRSNIFNKVLNLTVKTKGNVSSVNNERVLCEVVGSLISTFREFRALCLLKNGNMFRPILAPQVSYFQPGPDQPPDLAIPEYNQDQAKAISCGVAMVRREHKNPPKILLIHGPPGTGKSKTIVGLLQGLLSMGNENVAPMVNTHSKARRLRVLLCAPSNAAIDNLMKKIIVTFKAISQSPQGNCGDINLVRLGSERTINRDLKGFSLDSQTAKTQKLFADPDVYRKERLDQDIENLSQMCAMAKKDPNKLHELLARKGQLLREREQLSRQLKESRSKKQETQAKLLQNAHVICCTLSTSGSVMLESAFRRLGHEPFSCIIVDEAGQATETETLIPLLHQSPTFILVGDPEQLPPTVVSQKAKELRYDQSLLARLWKSLRQSNPRPSPVIFLSTQYRMHPDICEFPSKYIYNKALKNDCVTAKERCNVRWPFQPYRVFDVTDGQEMKENESFSNSKEVQLVLILLRLIAERHLQGYKVGVITPYNAQKQRILKAVRAKNLQVEVDTVDGFQGKEMDCIIVSCVRASSEMGSIGFVGNRQRMNVTITRAMHNLFILGHLRTLREHRDWGALVEDAGKRGTIIKTRGQDFNDDARKIFKHELLSRSLSHPPTFATRPRSPAEAPARIVMEATSAAPVRAHRTSYPIPTATRGQPPPLDGPRDPRLAARPRDPPPARASPIRDSRRDRDQQGRGQQEQQEQPYREANRAAANSRWPAQSFNSSHPKRSPEPRWTPPTSPKRRRR